MDLIGFHAAELDELLAAEQPQPTEEEEVPPTEALAVSRPGELWEMGRHR